jgi:hypothetical protein
VDRRQIQAVIDDVLCGHSADYHKDAVTLAQALMRCLADEITTTNRLSTIEARRTESICDKNALTIAIEEIAAITPSERTLDMMHDATAVKNIIRPVIQKIGGALVAARALK